jgi:hypothetical protein
MKRASWLFIILLMVTCVANVRANDPAIAYYSFNNSSNPGHDDSGNGHNLTMSGSWSLVAGVEGLALHTETSGTPGPYVSTSGMNYPTQNGFSVGYWFKMGSSSDQIAVRDYWQNVACGETFGLRFDPTSSVADFFVRTDFTNVNETIVSAPVTAQSGDWVHLLGVYNPNGYIASLYINDVLRDSKNMSGAMRSQIAPYLWINGGPYGTTQGTIDEVKLYGYAVPEPATLFLLTLGGLALRRRK